MKNEHPEKEFDIRQNNFQESKLLLRFSINCPKPSCEQIIHRDRKSLLTQSLTMHLLKSKKHRQNKVKYSKESIKNHVNENFESELISNPRFIKC